MRFRAVLSLVLSSRFFSWRNQPGEWRRQNTRSILTLSPGYRWPSRSRCPLSDTRSDHIRRQIINIAPH